MTDERKSRQDKSNSDFFKNIQWNANRHEQSHHFFKPKSVCVCVYIYIYIFIKKNKKKHAVPNVKIILFLICHILRKM